MQENNTCVDAKEYFSKENEDKYLNQDCHNCPVGGGQSCIVARRRMGDYVLEDEIFKEAGLTIRLNCSTMPSKTHDEAYDKWMKERNNPDAIKIVSS